MPDGPIMLAFLASSNLTRPMPFKKEIPTTRHLPATDFHHVHFIGICGKGMAGLAISVHEMGLKVTGSDHEPYGASFQMLMQAGIIPNETFAAEFLEGADCVVVSRNYDRGNVEIEVALEKRIRLYSMPQFISDFFLQGRQNLVVAGTKGKTTTTAMLAKILSESKLDVGYFIGGALRDNGRTAQFPAALNVLEGDDYESSFWDPCPKFLYYWPETVVLTNIFLDHPEFHGGSDGSVAHFSRLIRQIPRSGCLIVGSRGELAARVVEAAPCQVQSVGFEEGDDFRIENWLQSGSGSSFSIAGVEFRLLLIGRYNALNAAMAAAAAQRYGVSLERSAEVLSSFPGVIGRQDLIGEVNGIHFYTDLAYLPECLGPVLESFRIRHPGSRTVLLYQPFIVNSMPGVDVQLAEAMKSCDLVLVANVYKLKMLPMKNPEFSDTLCRMLGERQTAWKRIGDLFEDAASVLTHLQPGDVVISIVHPRTISVMENLVAALK